MLNQIRILLIDDDTLVRCMLREFLEFVGFEVQDAADGATGLDLFHRRPADLILMDLWTLPRQGQEAIGTVRRRYPGVKVIVIPGGAWDDSVHLPRIAVALGVHKAIRKPFRLAEVLAAIHEVLAA